MNIFVYGSLMFSEIVFALTGEKVHAVDAILYGYSRYTIQDRSRPSKGPVLLQDPKSSTRGKLLLNVSAHALSILDKFENEFTRIPVTVSTEDGEEAAQMYKWKYTNHKNLVAGWDVDEFIERHLSDYLKKLQSAKTTLGN